MITVRHLVCGACFVALAALAVPEPCQAQIVGRILGGGRKSSGGGRPGVLGGLRGSGSGGPLSGGGLLGGRRAPARSDNSSSNYARSLESNRQWLSDYGKQSPQVRVSNSNPAKTAPQGKAAVRPDGVLSKSDLGIASKTAEQAQKAQQGAAQGSQAGALGKSNLAQGESPPGKPSDNFQGEGVKSAIFTGVVVAASLAQNQQLGDAYDDSWVSPGGSFVSYSEDDKGYVYHGYHDGASDDASAAPVTTGGTPGSNSTPDGAQEHSVARPPTRDSDGAVKVPAKNPLPDQVTVADRKVAKRIAREIDRLLAAEVESISQPLASYLLTDEVRVEFLKSHVTAGMDAAIVQELNNALIDLDAEAVERAAKKLNLPNDAWASLGPHARLTRALLDLKKLVKEEHSTDAVDAFSRRLDNSLADFGLNQGERDGLAASTNAVLDSLRIRLSLDNAPTRGGGELIDAPQGEVPVLYFPPLAPAGKVYLLGGSTLGVGTATPGTLVVGRSEVRELMGVPHMKDSPIEAISADKAQQAPRNGTLLLNPSKLGQSFSYTINDAPFTIGPGQSQHLPAGITWVIKFDRGDGTQAHYTLAEGAYAFTADKATRDVTTLPCEATIENPSLTGRFNLLVDHEAVSIPPGQALSLRSSYPIVVAFDRGVGGEPAYRRLTRGTIAAGINSADGGWDLFEADATKADGPAQASANAPAGVQ